MPHRVSPSFQVRRALLRHLAPRYRQASPAQKTLLLDSFVEWTGYTRKYAIALLNHGEQDRQRIQRRRLPQYRPAVQQALFMAWKATHYVCAKRLLPSLPSLVALLEQHGHLMLAEEERRQLLVMSVSTAERLLRTQRKSRLHGLSTTTPAPWRKAQIPVRTFSPWEEDRPGFVEMDLEAHCGDHLDGSFLYTLTLTDLATGWTECIPLLEKSADAVLAALEQARTLFPFPLLGIDTDSGSEFLNGELIAYCEQEHLTFTRGRPGAKNDQCHVEQKNGAVVREAVGCARLVGMQAYQQLREVYRALRLLVNYFQPSLKLQAKVLRGDRVRRVYDAAQTPLQRLLASGVLSKTLQRDLIERVEQIDPLALSEHLDVLRYALMCGVHTIATGSEGEFVLPLLRFSLLACTSGPLPVSEERPAQADHCEEPCPPERIQEDHSKSLQTERHLEEAVWEASQHSAQAQPMHVSPPSTSSSTTEEHEADHLALTTVEQAMAAYARSTRAFCNWLVRQGYVSETPFPQDSVPQALRCLPQVVEPEAFVRLLQACQLPGSLGGLNAGMAARNRAILWLGLPTGLQVSELCGLRLTDVDRTGGTVTVRGKKGHLRTFPLSADGQRAVGVYLDLARLTPAWEPTVPEARDLLLLTERRHPLTKNSLTLLFLRLSQRAGFARESICPSMLRDTYAIRFLLAGGKLAALQEQLGVADLASVKRYQHFCGQRRQEQEIQACSEKSAFTQQSRRDKSKRRKEQRRGRGRRRSS